jgi:hypothetical protein
VLFVPHGWRYSELLLDESVSVEGTLVHSSNETGDRALLQQHTDAATEIAKKPTTTTTRGTGLQWGNLVSSQEGSGTGFRFC